MAFLWELSIRGVSSQLRVDAWWLFEIQRGRHLEYGVGTGSVNTKGILGVENRE